MKKEKLTLGKLGVPVGLLLMSVTQLIHHYIILSDAWFGALMGLGIGIMIVSVIKNKARPTC